MSWPDVSISEVCELAVDCINKTAPVVEHKTQYKMLRTTNVRGGFVDVDNVRYVTEDTFEKWNRRAVPQKGDVILTREAPLGDVGRLTSDDKVFLGQRLFLYRADPAKLDSLYLAYVLQSPVVQGRFKSKGFGATVQHAKVGDCENLLIPYPPLEIQKKIGNILASYDDLIENNRRRVQLLEESARLLYQEWFVHLRFPGNEQVKITDGIPEGWEKSSLENHILFSNGKAKKGSEEGSLPIYGANGIIGYGNNSLFSSGVVIGRVGAYCGSTMLALTKFWGSDNTIVAQASSERFGLYFLYFLLTKLDLNRFAGGAAQPLLTQTNLKKIEALFPAQQLCQEFDAFVRDIYSQINTLTEKNKKLGQARDLLLPKLMSGELTI